MAYRVTLSDRCGSSVTWSSFPTLEQLYDELAAGGRSEFQRRYFEAVVAACKEEAALALAVELSVVDRRSSVSDHVSFYTSFYRLRSAPVELILGRRGDVTSDEPASPYEAAMAAMTEEGSSGRGEPIVLHPGLRDPELLYLLSPALSQPMVHRPLVNYALEQSRRWEGTLGRTAETAVEEQVRAFRDLLQEKVRDFDRGYGWNNMKSSAETLFESATLLVVPFLRDPWSVDGQAEAVGGFRDFTMQAGGASGLVTFIWLVPTRAEGVEGLGHRVGARILELHRVLTMKESLLKSSLLVRKNHFIQSAAHDITTQINTLQLETLRSHFFKGLERHEITASRCRFRLDRGSPDEADEDVAIIAEFAAAAEDVHEFVKAMLQAMEIGTGPRFVRDKFQTRRRYTAEELLSRSVERANGWMKDGYPHLNLIWRRFPGTAPAASIEETISFPIGYYGLEVLSGQLTEVLINARRHGLPDDSGAVPVHVSLYCKEVGGVPFFCVKLANDTRRRLARVSDKTSPLNYAEGLGVHARLVDRPDGGQRYSVEFRFGPTPRECGLSGPLTPVSPERTTLAGGSVSYE